jgi:hypothetical protein
MSDFSGWIPLRVYWNQTRPMVDWGWLGERRLTEPFFDQTAELCVQHPADLLFRHQTPLEELGAIVPSQPALPPAGFIFHLSRCGSTLISQMLAALPENVVLSEASPLDAVLRAPFRDPRVTEEQRLLWFRWLVGVLGWQRHPGERNLFIKFDCWHTLFLPLIRRAFPAVPWIFVYRDPLEVMVSHAGHRGGQMIPGVLEPGLFGWERPAVEQMAPGEYGARVLAKICEAALAQVREGNGMLVNYRQLPDAAWPALMDHWRMEFTAAQTARMQSAALLNAKNPVLPFEPDSQAKQASATPALRALTQQWLEGPYRQLEAERQARGLA